LDFTLEERHERATSRKNNMKWGKFIARFARRGETEKQVVQPSQNS